MAILILVAFTVLAYVVLILPRQRELKRHQALMSELEVGEDVMMTSGIYGVIRDLDGEYVQLEIADGVEIRIAKRSIAARVEPVDPSVADSVVDGDIGQTPVSTFEAPASEGDDGDEAVNRHDDGVETATENEA